MVLLSSLLSSSGNIDLLGIAVGHVYYFFEVGVSLFNLSQPLTWLVCWVLGVLEQDVYPRMTPSHIRLLRTPSLLCVLFFCVWGYGLNHVGNVGQALCLCADCVCVCMCGRFDSASI